MRAAIGGRFRTVLLDTGSSISLIQPGVCGTEINRATVTPYGVTGEELRVKGEQRVIFTINGETYTHDFCVCSVATEDDAILGTDFLLKMDARLDFENGKFCLKRADQVGHDHPKRKHCESQGTAAPAALTVFSHKDGRKKERSCWIGHRKRDVRQFKQNEKTEPEIELKNSESWLVKTTQEIRIAPRVKQMVIARVDLPRRQEAPPLVCVEPAQLPNEGVHAARGLSLLLQPADLSDE